MARRDALREIDYPDLPGLIVKQQVELIKIAMYQTIFCELYQQIQGLLKHSLTLVELHQISKSSSINVTHYDSVPVPIKWNWGWKPCLMKGLHEQILFGGRDSREIKPVISCSVFNIIPVQLDCSE